MEFAAEFTVGTELDVDALIQAESDEIQRLLHCAFFLARHSIFLFLSFSTPALTVLIVAPFSLAFYYY